MYGRQLSDDMMPKSLHFIRGNTQYDEQFSISIKI